MMKTFRLFIFTSLFIIGINSLLLAQQGVSIVGKVSDTLNYVIAGATVTVADSSGNNKTVITNRQGEFSFSGLAPGKYTIKAKSPGFSVYQSDSIEITAGKRETLSIVLSVEEIVTNVDVGNDGQLDLDPSNNASQTVLKGKDIDDLPDNPDDFRAYLQALAGPAAGRDGANLTVDGFSNSSIPPKDSIREIRFNQNPFSAEYDRIGLGRVEILTKPGADKFSGSASFNFNDESLNSRNPFSSNRAPSQTRNFSGSFNGPIRAKKSSFHVDSSYNRNDNGNVINATVLDSVNNIIPLNQEVTVPFRRFQINPRVDFAINNKNTFQIRYEFTSSSAENQGIGDFSLLSRAFTSNSKEHEIRLRESMIINPRTVNETLFRMIYNNSRQEGDDSIPTIKVANAFTGGGSQFGSSFNRVGRWELQNFTITSFGKNSEQAIKFGIRVRGVNIHNRLQSGYNGVFTFGGITDPFTGQVLYSSIEQYRQKVSGNPDPRFNPNQFSITAGNPLASVSQTDYGLFITDDWKARKDLTLSFGLRYENQTNIKDKLNFAPRFAFAWQPDAGATKQPKTVFRGGFGIFYERFGENNTLSSLRNDGVSQLRYTVTNNPAILGQAVFTNEGITNVPAAAQLASLAPLTSIPYNIASNLQAPYSIQSTFSVERQLPLKTTLSATFIAAKGLHLIRLRNINAPVCPPLTVCPILEAEIQLLRPDKAFGNIYQYESSGYSNTKQLVINFNTKFNKRISLFGNYTLSYLNADTDGLSNNSQFNDNPVGFPAYSYDLKGEYAPLAFNARHTVFVGGSIDLPLRFRLSPTITYNSERKFNITTGVDLNRDSVFAERPTFTELKGACDNKQLTDLFCHISGIANPDTTIIPHNYGIAPGNFNVNMSLSKTLNFGTSKTTGNNQNNGGGSRAGSDKKPYNITVFLNVRNLFNTVNLASPQGALTSPFFGKSTSTAGGVFGAFGGAANRRVDLTLRFNW